MKTIALAILLISTVAASAQERLIVVAASPELSESGLLKYLLPRFSLKTGIRAMPVDLAGDVEADILVGPESALGGGRPAFRGEQTLYHVQMTRADMESGSVDLAERFLAWIESDIGQRTIDSFRRDGTQLYVSAASVPEVVETRQFDGDVVAGERLSLMLCGRCHVVGPVNRMKGLGSTPSFGMLRTLEDWELRFRKFHLLNPHPSFTQVAGVTEPFHASFPSPIAPIEMTLQELEAIIAYMNEIEAADLGAPFEH